MEWHTTTANLSRGYLCEKKNDNNNNGDDDINEQMYENWPILYGVEQGMLNHKHVAPSNTTYAANWIMCMYGKHIHTHTGDMEMYA